MSEVAINHLFGFPEAIEKLIFAPSRSGEGNENRRESSNIPIDILESPKEYIFYMDVPGISKSDIQVTVEEERTLVIKSNGKRKREDHESEGGGCKYIRLERRLLQNLVKKFRLPEDADVAAVKAKYQEGVLTVTVGKLPPQPPKPKTVQISVS
uniref:17.4 kDa class III heat shock protein n=1 Tax=Noccaea caerulescens TaxID=107243 RepID=A0A1J3EAQ1_NOCCA